jgi:hypothetical protein
VNAGGSNVATVPTTAGMLAMMPELSADNSQLANVEASGYGEEGDLGGADGSIVTRSFDPTTQTFGSATVLVAADGSNSIANFYPSYSPDGAWIAYTRTTSQSYDDTSAETWVVKADGTLPPIQLATADGSASQITNSWPRWVPFGQTFGSDAEPLYYLTFSSKRVFGVRLPSGGIPQIWMTPFFPARALAGQDPSGPMFRVPFQDVASSNHIAQWTQEVVTE